MPEHHIAIAKPATSDQIPLLYVFDDTSAHVHAPKLESLGFSDPVFARLEPEAYWGELENGQLYQVPWLDKCSQSSMLAQPLNFHAPKGGLLFVQFTAPYCSECKAISKAIGESAAKHPDVPVRWVQIEVPRSVGVLER